MKIKLNNILDKLLEKMNLRRIEKEEKGQVIKFETKMEEQKSRKGALNESELKKEKVEEKKAYAKIRIMKNRRKWGFCAE